MTTADALTKHIDFDREPPLSMDSAKNGLPKKIVRAAAVAGICRPRAEVTKLTATTIRGRLPGETTGGLPLRSEVEMLAMASAAAPPSRPTIQRWLKDLVQSHELRPVIKSVYLNRLGHRDVSPATAAQWVRSRSLGTRVKDRPCTMKPQCSGND